MRWTKRIFYLISGLVLLLLIVLNLSALYFNASDKSAKKYFSSLNIAYQIKHVAFEDSSVRIVQTGKATDSIPLILFVHGASDTWDAFKQYLK